MEPTFEQFHNITSLFYRKIIRIHPKKLSLIDKYTKMLQHFSKRKDQNLQTPSNLRTTNRSRFDFDDNKSVSNHSYRSHSKSCKSIRNVKLKSIESQYLYLSTQFQKTVAFACYYNMINKDPKQMQIVQTKTKFILQSINQKQYPNINWQKSNLQWKKIKQLLPNKDKVRWQKILGVSLSALPQVFVSFILKGLLSLNMNAQLNLVPNEVSLTKLATQLKVTITYFQCQEGSITKLKQYKGGKNQIKIGYLISDRKYGCFQKLPQKKQSQKSQLQNTTLKVDNSLLKNRFQTKSAKSVDTSQKNVQQIRSKSKNSDQGSQKNYNQKKFLQRRNDLKSDNVSQSSKLGSSLNHAKKKVIRGLEAILKQSKVNTMKLLDLQCLKQDYEKEKKIKMRLAGK